MDLGISGKVALVAASSKGIGKAVALGLAREGARVTICARGEDALNSARAEIARETGIEVYAVKTDVNNPAELKSLVDKVASREGKIDILVTNAGGPPSASFMDLDDAKWEESFHETLLSVVRLIRLTVPHMRKAGGGRIVNLTSASVKQPIDGLVLSNSLRAGVSGLSKTLSSELAKDNILVNCVGPGFTVTERLTELAEARAKSLGKTVADILQGYKSAIPLGRLATPDEIANAVIFLASARASFITGISLLVDGGYVRGN